MTEIRLPLSQARRRLSQIIRHLSKYPQDVFYITRKGEPWICIVSVGQYEAWQSQLKEAVRLVNEYSDRSGEQ